jgi:hypothetical protein
MKQKTKTIISASRRTDIPAFHYQWLQDVLQQGEVELVNPRFPEKSYRVDLNPENVHSIVLWSKDYSNVLKNPGILENYNLFFQYTINSYSKLLEPLVPEYGQTLRVLEGLLKKYDPRQFQIRFDPVLLTRTLGEIEPTPEKPGAARLAMFERLCRDMGTLGMQSCRIITSYLCLYPHVKKRLASIEADMVPLEEAKRILFFERMAEIACKYGLLLYSCSNPVLEEAKGIQKASCIDGALLESVFCGRVRKSKDAGQRQACGCTCSRDIGSYVKNGAGMSCGHGCVYCYAT